MTFKPNDETGKWEAPPGVAPWRELTDDEFAAIAKDHPGIERFFDRIDDAGTRKKKTAKAAEGVSNG